VKKANSKQRLRAALSIFRTTVRGSETSVYQSQKNTH